MLFDDANGFKWKPHYIQVVRRAWLGESRSDIANDLGLSLGTVAKILDCDQALMVFNNLTENTVDTMREVQAVCQAVALEAIQVKIDTLKSGNESLRNKAASELLALAGHTPTQRVEITKSNTVVDKYKDKSELDLRRELLAMLRTDESLPTDRGPDGGLIN